MSRFLDAIELPEQGSPPTPASGMLTIFSKGDGLYYKRDDAVEVGPLAAGGGMAELPANAVTSANATAHKMTVAGNATPPPTPATGDVWVVNDIVTTANATLPAFSALGDLVVGTGPSAGTILPAGANGYVLTADNTQPTGLAWTAAATGGTSGAPANMVTTDTEQTISAAKTFTVSPVVPDGAFAIAKIANLQTTLDAKYSAANPQPAPTNMLTTDTAQSIGGVKTFANGTLLSASLQASTGNSLLIKSQDGATKVNASNTAVTFFSDTTMDGAGSGVLGLPNATTVPTVNPTGGVVLYAEAGTLRVRQANGTVITVASSDLTNYATLNTAQTFTAAKTFTVAPAVPDGAFAVSKLTTTGTASTTTFLRGDGAWSTVPAPANMVTTDTSQGISGAKDFTTITRSGQALTPNVEPYPFSHAGTLTVRAGVFKLPLAAGYVIESIQLSAGTASAGASVIVDVNRNGTSVYTTQANRPTLAAGAVISTAAAPDVTTLVAGDYLTVDIDQVGTTTAGADLTVLIRLRRT